MFLSHLSSGVPNISTYCLSKTFKYPSPTIILLPSAIPDTHRHTQTHTNIHICTNINIHTLTWRHTPTHTDTHTDAYTHKYSNPLLLEAAYFAHPSENTGALVRQTHFFSISHNLS